MAEMTPQDKKYFKEQGFIAGPLPAEYQKFFGSDPSVVGYKVVTNPNGTTNIVVARPQGDADGGLQFQQFGNTLRTNQQGTLVPGASPTEDYGDDGAVGDTADDTGGVSDLPEGVTVVSTYADPTTGDVTAVLSNGQTKVLAKSGAQDARARSAYDLLYQEFNNLGIGALVPDLKTFIEEGISPAEFTLRLRQTDAYKKRFAANAQRVAKGLRAISEAEYVSKEDVYQDIMRRYGLPESYYTRGELGRQEGFEKLIANDVSDVELEDRISTAQRRVINANPEVTQALKQFYPGISNGDILAYALDPSKAIEDIKRKVTAAEIGGAQIGAGLAATAAGAESLAKAGITGQAYQRAAATIAEDTLRGGQLAAIYNQSPYTQQTAEANVLNVPGSAAAKKQTEKLKSLEEAAFSGRAGMGVIARDRAGAI